MNVISSLIMALGALFRPSAPEPEREISVEQEAKLRAHGYQVKRPRFTKQDVRYAARVVAFPEIPDVFYAETSDGLEVTGQLTGTGLEPATVRCKAGEENRMRTGFIRFLCDGPSRDRLRK